MPGLDELNRIVHDYRRLAQRLGRPPMQCDWMLTEARSAARPRLATMALEPGAA